LSAGLSTINEWECKICQHKNFNSNVCSLCGVTNQPAKDSQQKDGGKSDPEGIICSTCTFINHSELKFCEVCESALPDKAQLPTISPTTSPTSSSSKGLKDDSYIKLSFRKGGLNNILTALNKALAQKRWETQDPSNSTNQSSSSSSRNVNNSSGNTTNSFGIDSLIKQNELKNNQINTELTDAFSDLDKLMEKATIMIDLANSINNKLKASSTSTSGGGDNEKFELDKIMASIGIESPVTQKTSGDKFFLDLSRELSLFLQKFIDKKPYQGLIDLVEVYCIFNKARTLNLVSPTDLLMASNQFDKVGSPLTVKKFGNGVTIIQSERFNLTNLTSFILDKLNASDEPLIIRELAIEWNLSLSCAEEYIKVILYFLILLFFINVNF
jgi:ESCRT-II complex subunit VPS36